MKKSVNGLKNKANGFLKTEGGLIATLTMIQLTHLLDVVIMSPLSDYLIKDFNISTKQFGLLLSSYAISASISCLAGAIWADYFERKKLMAFCYSGFLLSTLACAISNSFSTLLIARTVAGIFGGVLSGLVFTVLGDVIPVERRGKATGVLMSSFGISSVLGLPLGLLLAEQLGWNYSFYFVAILSVFVLVMIFVFMPTLNEHIATSNSKNTLNFLKQIPGNQEQSASLFFVSMLMFSGFLFIPFISPYLINNIGYARKDLWMIYFFGGIISFIASRFIGRLIDIHGNRKMVLFGTLFSVFPILLVTNMPIVPMFVVLSISTLFFLGNSGRMVPAVNLLNGVVKSTDRGKFMSINSFFQNISLGLASFLGGVIIQFNPVAKKIENFNYAGIVSVMVTLLSLVILFQATKEKIKINGNSNGNT
ncbi:MAG: MFS transporter [Cytophagales bacterium]